MFGIRTRAIAVGAAFALVLTGFVASASHSSPISGRTWVAAPNGVVGVQQTVIVRAPRSAGSVATVTFANPGAGTNAGQAAINEQGFAYLPWTPNIPGTWNITASVGTTSLGTTTIAVGAMPTTTILLAPGEVQENRPAPLLAEVREIGRAHV